MMMTPVLCNEKCVEAQYSNGDFYFFVYNDVDSNGVHVTHCRCINWLNLLPKLQVECDYPCVGDASSQCGLLLSDSVAVYEGTDISVLSNRRRLKSFTPKDYIKNLDNLIQEKHDIELSVRELNTRFDCGYSHDLFSGSEVNSIQYCTKLKIVYQFATPWTNPSVSGTFYYNEDTGGSVYQQQKKEKILSEIVTSVIRNERRKISDHQNEISEDEFKKKHIFLLYSLNMMHVLQDIENANGNYQSCLYDSFVKYGISFNVLDAWHSNKAEKTSDPTNAPTPSPVATAQNVIVYGMLENFSILNQYQMKRRTLEVFTL